MKSKHETISIGFSFILEQNLNIFISIEKKDSTIVFYNDDDDDDGNKNSYTPNISDGKVLISVCVCTLFFFYNKDDDVEMVDYDIDVPVISSSFHYYDIWVNQH